LCFEFFFVLRMEMIARLLSDHSVLPASDGSPCAADDPDRSAVVLGKGHSGPVVAVEYEGIQCAMKQPRIASLDDLHRCVSEIEIHRILSVCSVCVCSPEVRARSDILSLQGHPNIIRLVGVWHVGGSSPGTDSVRIVTERATYGSLSKNITSYLGPAHHRKTLRILRDVASALALCHSEGIAHGDVKPENILLGSNGQSAYLCDFGISFRSGDVDRRRLPIGQWMPSSGGQYFAAPEQRRAGADVTTAADVFPFGITAIYVLSGEHPFVPLCATRTGLPTQVDQFLLAGGQPLINASRLPLILLPLLAQCVASDPTQRPSMAQVVCMLDAVLSSPDTYCESVSGTAVLYSPTPVRTCFLCSPPTTHSDVSYRRVHGV
jgi:serine/threonine protein kinase